MLRGDGTRVGVVVAMGTAVATGAVAACITSSGGNGFARRGPSGARRNVRCG